jgi:transcription antitermination protein NusB
MANRHLSRSIVIQTLFEVDFRNYEDGKIREALERNADEFAPGMADMSFMKNLISGILGKKSDIDLIIEKAAPDWPIDKISYIDRNVLRLGLYELLFADKNEVPPKVAINEAIEIAKSFGGENSGKFVNGVLGSVYKEIGEPGKDETSARKPNKFNTPYEEMPIEKLGGSVVFAVSEGNYYIALVHDVFGHWTLPKGKIEEGENEEEATIREIKEEIGIGVKIIEELGVNEYVASDPEKGKIRKQVKYFLTESAYEDLTLGPSGGLDGAAWFKLQDILDLNFYDDILPIITKALNILLQKSSEKAAK